VHPLARARAHFGQRFQHQLAVIIRPEYRLPPIPATHDVVQGTCIFYAYTSRHAITLPAATHHPQVLFVHMYGLTPFS
jgi:hypothetical protein